MVRIACTDKGAASGGKRKGFPKYIQPPQGLQGPMARGPLFWAGLMSGGLAVLSLSMLSPTVRTQVHSTARKLDEALSDFLQSNK